MSRSSYSDRTTSNVDDRDYESRRERERDRLRSADNVSDSRHHGKWTASGEVSDLEGGNYSSDRNRSSRNSSLGNRSYSDRERVEDDYDYQQSRNRGVSSGNYASGQSGQYGQGQSYGNQQQYGSSPYTGSSSQYGNQYSSGSQYATGAIPPPPPMPPADFYMPHGNYRQSHPYTSSYGGYGDSSYGSSDYFGDQYGSGAYGSGSHYGSGFGGMHSGYGSSGYGSSYGGMHPHHYQLLLHQQSRGLGGMGGLGQSYGNDDYYFGQPHGSSSGFGSSSRGFGGRRSLSGLGGQGMGMGRQGLGQGQGVGQIGGVGGFGQGRPQCDIYELGNDYIIEVDLPGHARDHVDIKLAGNELFVVSRPPKRDHTFHINERSLGRHIVERKFYLPADVTTTSIAPVLANGVLRVTLPRNQTLNNQSGVLAQGQQAQKSTTTVTDTATTTTSTNQAVTL